MRTSSRECEPWSAQRVMNGARQCLGSPGIWITVDFRVLQDAKYLAPWELWHYSIQKSCRIFGINGMSDIEIHGNIMQPQRLFT